MVINVGLRYGGSGMVFDLVDVVVSSYVLKLIIAVSLTPLIYALHGFVHRLLHVERLSVTEMGD